MKNTCCVLPDGDWGCCPIDSAICCIHSRCVANSGLSVLPMMVKKQASKRIRQPVKDNACDATHSCNVDYTCCKMESGEWGCCPTPNAVCCEDHLHCCPDGWVCQSGSGECAKGLSTIPWLNKESAIVKAEQVEAVQCDSTHYCPSGNTCCKLSSGQWGCCPVLNAVCCSDHVHCCPSGTLVDWRSVYKAQQVEDVQCDSTHYCPSGNTCVGWHLVNGDVAQLQMQCVAVIMYTAVHPVTLVRLVGAHKAQQVEDVQCDSTHTVLQETHVVGFHLVNGDVAQLQMQCVAVIMYTAVRPVTLVDWGQLSKLKMFNVTPLTTVLQETHAVGFHLVNGVVVQLQMQCVAVIMYTAVHPVTLVQASGCAQGLSTIPWLNKESAIVKAQQLASGQWGCCPAPNAVCCSDHVHCCPSGYTCQASGCAQGLSTIPWLNKESAIVKAQQVEDVQCDSTHYCPSGNTCCRLASGQWDVASFQMQCVAVIMYTAVHPVTLVRLVESAIVKAQQVEDVQCDSTHYCPSGNTCCRLHLVNGDVVQFQMQCVAVIMYTAVHPVTLVRLVGAHKLASGQWGCCQFQMQCVAVIMYTAVHPVTLVRLVVCTRSVYHSMAEQRVRNCQGSARNTCCRLASGQWGCCQLQMQCVAVIMYTAVRPAYTCSTGTGQCIKGLSTIPWLNKESAIVKAQQVEDVQCDSTHYCPSGNTCVGFHLVNGDVVQLQMQCVAVIMYTAVRPVHLSRLVLSKLKLFNVTPLITVLQETHVVGFHLVNGDVVQLQMQCVAVIMYTAVHPVTLVRLVVQGLSTIPWLNKESAIVKAQQVEDVQCDSTHTVLQETHAVGFHLVNGDVAQLQMQCVAVIMYTAVHPVTLVRLSPQLSRLSKLKMFNVTPLTTVLQETHAVGFHLVNGMLSSPNAVCCSDHVHCCPSGYTCQASGCAQGLSTIPWLNKESAIVKAQQVEDVQCDSTHYCPSGNTCCRLASGQWGCCPAPNAVCCSDHVHCCPSGYTCQASGCAQGLSTIPWLNKESAIFKAEQVEAVQCDSTHTVLQETHACRLASGQWGCCPVPNAVCCSDHMFNVTPLITVLQETHAVGFHLVNGVVVQFQMQCVAVIMYTAVHPVTLVGLVGAHKMFNVTPLITVLQETHAVGSSGQWGCCPAPNAVCCSDHVHCCPSGTLVQAMFNVTPLTTVLQETHAVGSSGQWGCCPAPNAVCCSDHVHCCPSGYTCQASGCAQGLSTIPWLNKESAIVKAQQLSSGQWGCCPVQMQCVAVNAVCCSDHVHCCPSGYTCQASGCAQGLSTIPWLNKESAIVKAQQVEDVQCDSTHYCPSGNTCCKLSSGQWGCCPAPNAVCCSDHVHCCPSGYTCQASGLSKLNVQCDSTHCPSGNTCCRLASGQWGCCPAPNAVCCSDHVHCCPSGYTCQASGCAQGLSTIPWLNKESAIVKAEQVEAVQCDSTHYCPSGNMLIMYTAVRPATLVDWNRSVYKGSSTIPWLNKESAIVKAQQVEAVQCDSTHYCPSGNTCCRLSSGQWGCCPVPNAVCCSDHVHCCPSGYTCSTGTGQCIKGSSTIPWLNKESAIVKAEQVEAVQCDSTHYCPSGNTCCKLSSGQWGCCPAPNAVCCSDHVHCCPSGYTCSTGTGQCIKGLSTIPWLNKESAIVKAQQVEDVQCDSTHYCPSGNTCCRLASGQWGCCPAPNAVCCSDHVHCCPSGYTCQASGCAQGLSTIPWLNKESAIVKAQQVEDVQCDSTHYCPSGNTCLIMYTAVRPVHLFDWNGQCIKGSSTIPWLNKESAIVKAQQVEDVQCDSTHYCPSGNTCCRLASGQWGCCPAPNAVCCSDHVHCCPSGYTCQASGCAQGLSTIPWLNKESAIVKAQQVEYVQCDSTHTVLQETHAVAGICDHVHCCPSGYTCQASGVHKAEQVEAVQCDSTHYCPSGNTCCKLSSGQWGCCPVPNAVCCSDHLHCCPSGYTCSTGTGQCIKGSSTIPWLNKESAIVKAQQVEDVQCDSTHYCPSGNTCCRLASGQWGCCPAPNAVCCSDHVHCCPSGYTCSTGTGECKRGFDVISWMNKIPASKVSATYSVRSSAPASVSCNDQYECPDEYTCCHMLDGGWGCCPYMQAVCCEDGMHCCPNGYTCDSTRNRCIDGRGARRSLELLMVATNL
ncbi:GRN [Bugula neritina]|uniref:GRN n=1 Tax=Bugula neritina TaxID=10212 RepID=A0A7J7JML2_BUGNE|nr:GRN [Bugula neritina]